MSCGARCPDEPPIKADQPQTCCIKRRRTPIQQDGSTARVHWPDVQKSTAWCMIRASPRETTFVAKENGKVIAVCRIIRHEDKSVMEAIYVLPEYQGLGIGSAIWRETQKLLDSNSEIIVQVATYNTDAIEFYKRCGFRDTGKRWEEKKFKLRSGAAIPAMEMVAKRENE